MRREVKTFDGMIVRVEGSHRKGRTRVWINGVDMTYWLRGPVKIEVQSGYLPQVTLTFAPDRLWYETMKHDDEEPTP